MAFHFIDDNWKLRTFPLYFFETKTVGKTADEHEAIMKAAISKNDKVGDDVLVFSMNSDNEVVVPLGVDQYLSFDGSVRSLSRTLALAVKDVLEASLPTIEVLEYISGITNYVNSHPGKRSELCNLQCNQFGPDRISILSKVCVTITFHLQNSQKLLESSFKTKIYFNEINVLELSKNLAISQPSININICNAFT